MKAPTFRRRVLAAAMAALVAGAAAPLPALSASSPQADNSQSSRGYVSRRSKAKPQAKATAEAEAPAMFPNAKREAPGLRATEKGSPKLKKLVKHYEEKQSAEARAVADELIANEKSNAYERAFAAQIAAQAAYEANDFALAETYAQRAVEFNGMDNDAHFSTMLMLAQLQLQQDKYAEAITTFDRFFGESGAEKPEAVYHKSLALYRLKRYPEAIATVRKLIESSSEPKGEWQQLLMQAYAETGQSAEAAKLAETLAARTPNDKRSQLNLAATYMQTNAYDKAIAVFERLRAAGQLTEERDYTQLYRLYANVNGREKDSIAVIEEGLQKGLLKPDHTTYLVLAQSYYFTEQLDKSIDAYRKAAPLASDGETYLNLAKALWAAERIPEAKEAARQAKAKGVKKPKDVEQILSLP